MTCKKIGTYLSPVAAVKGGNPMNLQRKKILAMSFMMMLIFLYINLLYPIHTQPGFTSNIGKSSDINAIDFTPDGKFIASISVHGNIIMWDISTGKQARQFIIKDRYALSLCFSPNGKFIAAGYDDGNIYLWDTLTGKKIKKIYETTLPIISICFSPNGKYITSASNSHFIRLWEVETGRENRVLEKSSNYICSIAFSKDSKTIAAGYNDGTIGLWDINSSREIKKIYGHKGVVYSICFTDDNRIIASSSSDGTIRLWNVKFDKEIKTMYGNSGRVYSISMSPNGRTIASGSEDATIRLWDVEAGKEILSMTHSARIYSVKFSPNGKILASGSSDGTIRVWDFASGKEIVLIERCAKCKNKEKNGKLTILMKPASLQTTDGEITNFSIKVKNSGTKDLCLVRIIEDIDLNQKTPLVFHPSIPREKLAVNESLEIPCKISALSGYANPGDQTSILHLKITTANNSTIPIKIPVKINVPLMKFKIISAKLQKDYIKDTLVILLQYLGKQDLLTETEFNVQIGDYKLYEIIKSEIKVADKIELHYTVPEAVSLDGKSEINLIIKKMKHPVHFWKFPINSIDYPQAKWPRYVLLFIFVLTILVFIYILFFRNRFKRDQS